ncbi:MAG: hypothetical protein NT074_05680 [Methanomicrobiales archaeon]|jgi:hypothetical protein|nr:hypothetical protein [Methanomicrobiales archaeon]
MTGDSPLTLGEAVALSFVVIVNVIIVVFLVWYIPSECGRIAGITGGDSTCGITWGAYVIAVVNLALIALAGIVLVRRASFKR